VRGGILGAGPAAGLAAVGLLALGGACVRPLPAPPTLFPVSRTFVAPVGQSIEGPLATDGARIFAAGRDGAVTALDRATGAVAWRIEEGPGPLSATEAALVHRQAGGAVSSLDPATGSLRWRSVSGIEGSLPALIDGDRVIVVGEGAAALDLASGRVLWSVPAPPRATSPAAAFGPWVLVGEEDGPLRCRDRASGASLWTYKTAEPLVAAPVVDDERRVFLGATDRGFVSLDAKGGERWRWKLGADVRHPPALFRDSVLFAAHDDVLYALRRRDGHLAWRAGLPSRPLSGPILVGTAVLVACYESDVAGFDALTGKALGAVRTSSGLRTPPIVIGDKLYAGLRDRSVVALYLGDPKAVPPPPSPSPSPPAVVPSPASPAAVPSPAASPIGPGGIS